MKTAILSLLLAGVILLGCEDNYISPIKSDNNSYQLIKLPPKAGMSVETVFSVTKTINGDEGGELKIKETYVAEDGHTVKIDVKLEIEEQSFPGSVDITMTLDDVFTAVSFTPHMAFDIPAELKIKFEGIDLNQLTLTTNNYDFIYIADNGSTELVEHDGIDVDEDEGKIETTKAKLHHFSRYAFSR